SPCGVVLSAAWQPPEGAHGFASPPCDGFALVVGGPATVSRLRSVLCPTLARKWRARASGRMFLPGREWPGGPAPKKPLQSRRGGARVKCYRQRFEAIPEATPNPPSPDTRRSMAPTDSPPLRFPRRAPLWPGLLAGLLLALALAQARTLPFLAEH